MSQAETLTLIAQLRRANRRWKMIALGLLGLLLILLVSASLIVWLALVRVEYERRSAEAAIQKAKAESEIALQRAVQAKLEAEVGRRTEEKAHRDAGKTKQGPPKPGL